MVLSKMNNHEHRTKQTYESYTSQPLNEFLVEPSVSKEILLENNNITVSCKQIFPQAFHFYQKLQAKRMNFRPTSFQKPLFLASTHVTRRSYWWCVGGHHNRMFFSKNLHENGV